MTNELGNLHITGSEIFRKPKKTLGGKGVLNSGTDCSHVVTSTRPKRARMFKSKIKCMLICYFDCHGIVHKGFVFQSKAKQLINSFTKRFLENCEKRSSMWNQTTRTTGCCISTKHLLSQQFQETYFWVVRTFLCLLLSITRDDILLNRTQIFLWIF